ncbi:MAG: uroporphyrinogen-III synthase, partial [Steroidobacteraceae bacterium]
MNSAADKPVVVTRAESADGPLSRELKNLGLQVLLWPALRVDRADPAALVAALGSIRAFGWIVFASRHAVAAVLEHLPVAPAGVAVAAIGKATAQVLRQRGWPVDLTP